MGEIGGDAPFEFPVGEGGPAALHEEDGDRSQGDENHKQEGRIEPLPQRAIPRRSEHRSEFRGTGLEMLPLRGHVQPGRPREQLVTTRKSVGERGSAP